jgi:putative chitobiose transport system substrate-binding protein
MAQTMTRRQAIGVAAVGAAAAFGLTGCVGTGTAKPQPTATNAGPKDAGTIQFWTINLKTSFGGYIQGMIDAYQSKYPKVTIDWVDVPGTDITTKLLAAIASGQTPDLVNYTSDTVGLFAGQMTDLTEFFTARELAVYSPKLVSPLKQKNGALPAIPWYNGGGMALALWNTSIVTKAGFDTRNAPKTFQQMLSFAQKVHATTGVAGTTIMPYSTTLQALGVPLISADRRKAAFNTAETAKILETYKTYYASGAIAQGAIGEDRRTYEQNLAAGNLAFTGADQSSSPAHIKKSSPNVYSNLAVTPGAVGPSGNYYLTSQQTFGVPKASKHAAAAAEFLKFITSPANQLAFCKLVAILPSTPSTLKDPFFGQTTGDPVADAAKRDTIASFARLVDGSLGSGNDASLRQTFDDDIRAFMSGSVTAQQALKNAANAWATALAPGGTAAVND